MECVPCAQAILDYLLINAKKSGARLANAYLKLAEKGHMVVYYWCVKGSKNHVICSNTSNIPIQSLPRLVMVLGDCLALAPRLATNHMVEKDGFVASAARCSALVVVTLKRNPETTNPGDIVEETLIYSTISREDIQKMHGPIPPIHT